MSKAISQVPLAVNEPVNSYVQDLRKLKALSIPTKNVG
jgi:hypothetical protein